MTPQELEADQQFEEFDANRFPLGPGVVLLEASAGTGKTFALAHLVLRLVAEQGIRLRRLLVVTFTDPAAAELRDRISRRLQEGLLGLEHLHPSRHPSHPCEAPPWTPPDPVLADWVERWGKGDNDVLRGRLLLALEELDGADITTIHGFARRSLQRQAMEAGMPPDLRLETDASGPIQQVVHDYWQQQVLALPATWLKLLRQRGISPESLRGWLHRLDGDPALKLDPLPADLPLDAPLAEWLPARLCQCWQRFRREWKRRGEGLEQDFRTAATQWRANAVGSVKTDPYSPKPRTKRVELIDAWLEGLDQLPDQLPDQLDPELILEALMGQDLLRTYFHPGVFSKTARRFETTPSGDPSLPQRPLLEAVADLVDGLAERVVLHASHRCHAELERRRERAGGIGFSQLLQRLDPGTSRQDPHPSDPSAAPLDPGPLLRAVAARYDVALVDEFQDTDPVQWRILWRAFGQGLHQLVMVGDPKQAIYRFRGGDLNTYRLASQQATRRFSLDRNFRATPELIGALNTLMAPGPRRETGLRRSGLAVPPVRAHSRRRGPPGPPIQLLWLGSGRTAGDKPPSRGALERELSDPIADHILGLLGRSLPLGEADGQGVVSSKPLEEKDICLLVGKHQQAELLREALERRGIASRLVSKADVFSSPAATALQRFLDALADPADANRLRLLAASPLLGWSGAAIAAAPADEWSALAGQLDRLARGMERQGLQGGLAQLLGSDGLARLALGGRLLADLHQVAGLVEERLHADRLGPGAAADWLRRLRQEPDRTVPEAHRAQSDREDGAVSVVTVHRSKGLEYPVVICPYLWQAATPHTGGPSPIGVRWHPPADDQPHLDLHLDHHWGPGYAASREHLLAEQAERERLAYVALTRAQHLLVLAWGPAAGQQTHPLFPWLFPHEPLPTDADDRIRALSDADWRTALEEEILRRQLSLQLVDPPESGGVIERRRVLVPEEPLGLGPVPQRRLWSGWGRSSYTSWTHADPGGLAPEALDEGRDTNDPAADSGSFSGAESETGTLPAPPGPESGPLADFPRGAAPGDCLHRILEQLDYRQDAGSATNRETVERELERAGLGDQAIEPLGRGLDQMLATPCGGPLGAFHLGLLERQERLNEMNFDLCLDRVRAGDLAAPFRDHPGGAFGPAYAERLALLPVDSQGFLTGSIDLVFRAPDAQGGQRWWVADWKSNWLGRRDSEGRPVACGPRHYGPDAMARLMATNHYPLQAHLYLVALHRYLSWRLTGYDPRRDLGGYVYVFLRGTPGAEAIRGLPGPVPGMFVEQPPLGRLLALDAALGQQQSSRGEVLA